MGTNWEPIKPVAVILGYPLTDYSISGRNRCFKGKNVGNQSGLLCDGADAAGYIGFQAVSGTFS